VDGRQVARTKADGTVGCTVGDLRMMDIDEGWILIGQPLLSGRGGVPGC
jgi:hypothetical protein